MTDSQTLQTPPSGRSARCWLFAAILTLGALRVLIFSLGFPLFNNVDEAAHFDLVYRYSTGAWPREPLPPIEQETAVILALYSSQEYSTVKPLPGMFAEPLWKQPGIRQQPWFPPYVEKVRRMIPNYEAASLPVYYAGAGLWCALGRGMGFREGYLVYWIRLLNVPVFILLIWITYRISILLFPGDAYYAMGLPLAAAFFPQDIYYGITSDTFSPLFFGFVMLLLLRIVREPAGMGRYCLTGLIIAATFLIKLSNFPVYVLAVFLLGYAIRQRRKNPIRDPRQAPGILLLTAAAVLPVLAWIWWSQHAMGDWSGASAKMRHFGWAIKPASEWLNHPIFTGRGLATFLADLTKTYWRGEYNWDGKPIQTGWMDVFYVYSTALLLAAAVPSAIFARNSTPVPLRLIHTAGFVMLLMAVLFLGALSIQFDYGYCPNPSREHPYFISGRLVFCTFIPFLLLYLQGLRSLFFRVANSALPLVVLSLVMLVLFAGEILLNAPVMNSEYNWFHLP